MWINSLWAQIGHLMFLGTTLSKEQNILKISAPGALAHPVRLLSFLTDFTIYTRNYGPYRGSIRLNVLFPIIKKTTHPHG